MHIVLTIRASVPGPDLDFRDHAVVSFVLVASVLSSAAAPATLCKALRV